MTSSLVVEDQSCTISGPITSCMAIVPQLSQLWFLCLHVDYVDTFACIILKTLLVLICLSARTDCLYIFLAIKLFLPPTCTLFRWKILKQQQLQIFKFFSTQGKLHFPVLLRWTLDTRKIGLLRIQKNGDGDLRSSISKCFSFPLPEPTTENQDAQ